MTYKEFDAITAPKVRLVRELLNELAELGRQYIKDNNLDEDTQLRNLHIIDGREGGVWFGHGEWETEPRWVSSSDFTC